MIAAFFAGWLSAAAGVPASDLGWYEVLVLNRCAIVTVNLSCSDPVVSPARAEMLRGCPCADGEVISPDRDANGVKAGFGANCNNEFCSTDGNYSAQFTLAPGTYYYGIPTARICSDGGTPCARDEDCPQGTWCTRANAQYRGRFIIKPCVPGPCCGAPADPGENFCSDEIDVLTCQSQRRYCASTGAGCQTNADCPVGVNCVDGVFILNQGVPTCDGDPCVMGACCDVMGACADNFGGGTTLANCSTAGSTFYGGLRCMDNPCPICPIESAEFCQSRINSQFIHPNDRLLGVRRADDFRPTGHSLRRICWYPCFIGVTADPGGHECFAPGTTPPDAFIAKIYENDFGKPGLLLPGIPGGGLELVVDSKAQTEPGSRCWRYSAPILPPQGLQVTPGDCLWLEVTGMGEVQAGGTCVVMTVDTADGNSYSMYDENELYEQSDFVKLDVAFCLDCGIEGESNPPGSQDGGCGNFPVACCKPDGTDPGTLPDCIDGGTYQQCVGTQGTPLIGVPFPFRTCADIGGPAGCPVPVNDLCQNAVTPIECQNQEPILNPGTCALSGGAPNIQEPCNLDVGAAPNHDCVYGFTTCQPLSESQAAYHCRFETSNILATTDGPSTSGSQCFPSGSNSFQADIWFTYVAPCNGYMAVINCGFPTYDSMVQVFGNHTATCTTCPIANNSQNLGCSDDNCSATGDTASEVRINGVKEGACYTIRLGGWSQVGSTSDARQAESGLDIGVVCDPIITTNPPVAAPVPHDRKKNRYVSFAPNNGMTAVAFRVQKTTFPTGSCWVQSPVQAGSNQYSAACGTTPVFRVWNEPVVHVGDCEIVPVASYSIFTNTPGLTENPTPLVVPTIDVPSINGKLWGDVIGTNNGIEWTAPNQLTNTQDILAVLANISNAAVKPTFQAVNLQGISSVDPCLNAFVNTADVLIVVKAAAGDAYPFTTDPGSCPVCP